MADDIKAISTTRKRMIQKCWSFVHDRRHWKWTSSYIYTVYDVANIVIIWRFLQNYEKCKEIIIYKKI